MFEGSINVRRGPRRGQKGSGVAQGTDWREMVAGWVGRLLLISAFFSLAAVVLVDGLVIRAISDLLGLINMPVEPSLFLVCLAFALAGAARRRLRAAHTVVVLVMVLNVFYTALVVGAGQLDESAIVPVGPLNGFGSRPAFGVSESEYIEFTSSRHVTVPAFILGVLVLVLVVASRQAFPARLARRSKRAAFVVLILGLVTSFTATVSMVTAFPGSLDGMRERLRWSVRAVLGVSSPQGTFGLDDHQGPVWLFALAGVLSSLVLVLTILVFWRSGRGGEMQSTLQELGVRRLLLLHGEEDSLGYFATRRDKSVVFSFDGKAALTYRTEGTTCVASGDPIGDRAAWADAIAVWLR